MGKRVVGFHVEAFALLILSGCYIGFLPEHYASVWEGSGEMRRLLPKRYEAVVSFASMTGRGRPHTQALNAFLACLHRAVPGDHAANGGEPAPRRGNGRIVGLENGAS